jgi:hypothetical protein
MWDVVWFLGRNARIVFIKQRPKKSRFLQTIAIFGIVFEGLRSFEQGDG